METVPKARALTLDVGGTLIEPWPSVGHVYAETAADNGYTGLDPMDLNRRFIQAWRNDQEFGHSEAAWARLVDETFGDLLSVKPSQTFFKDLYGRFGRAESWKIFDDVVPALEELASRGIPMAIVSNWDERLRPLLKELRLDGYFEGLMISSELYFAKPSTVIFEHALRRLGCPPEEVLHVGDSVQEDVQGARETGMQALLLDRHGNPAEGRLNSLMELLELLESGI